MPPPIPPPLPAVLLLIIALFKFKVPLTLKMPVPLIPVLLLMLLLLMFNVPLKLYNPPPFPVLLETIELFRVRLLEVPSLYVRPGEVAAFDMGNAGVKLDAESASGMIGALATLEMMRSAGVGVKMLDAAQEMRELDGGIERLDRTMPSLVEQLKLGKSSIQLEVK